MKETKGGLRALAITITETGEGTGPGWNLTDNRPTVTFERVLGDRRSERVLANGVEVGEIHAPASGGYRIPNTRETAEEKAPLVEYLLRRFYEEHASMPRVCVERNVPLLFHQAAEQILMHVENALDFGVLDRREFHGLLTNLQMLSINARPEGLRWFESKLGSLLTVSASRLDDATEIEFKPQHEEAA